MSGTIHRKIFFWTLVVTFFIITPTIIAYAFGYRYSNERGIFIYSGSITIKSNPIKVSIDINGEPTPKRKLNYLNRSYHVDSIRPGTYTITVHAPGYIPWTKDVSVHSGISTEFWNVLLPNEDPEIDTYNTLNITKFFPAPQSAFYAYTSRSGDVFSIYTLDTKTNETEHIYTSNEYSFTKEANKNIEWSPQSEHMIVPLTYTAIAQKEDIIVDGSELITETSGIINIETKEILFLHDLYPNASVTSVRWSPKEKDVVYFLSDGDLIKMDILHPEELVVLKDDVLAYDFSEDLILTAHLHTGIISSHEISNFDQSKQITTTSIQNISDCEGSCRLIGYDDKRIILIHKNGDLFLYNEGEEGTYPLKFVHNDVAGVQFSDDGKKLLFWTDHEIFAHFLREWESQPYRSENETLHVARFFSPLSQVQWSKEYEHIIFLLNNEIQLVELDHRDKNNMHPLYKLSSTHSEIFGDFRDNKLYFTNKQEGECCSLLYSFDFPEKTSLLGL